MRGHAVPDADAAATARTLAATTGLHREPSDAERARTLVAHTRFAALATIQDGYPFASLVGYAPDAAGRPVLLLSDLSEHTANLRADPRASLLVTAPGAVDPPAAPRTTLLGRLDTVAERDAAGELYRAAHPGSFWSGFADFHPFRMQVTGVRFIGGFARAGRVDLAAYTAAEPDPLHPHAVRIVAHMTDDHAAALIGLCRVSGGCPDTGWARMKTVDRYGFDVLAAVAEGDPPRAVRISFPRPVDTPDACRAAMIDLAAGVPGADR